jgi:hypothetical protein
MRIEMTQNDDLHADELQGVIDQLRAHRPEATPLELDAIKQRVRTRTGTPVRRRARSAGLMKSRLAIVSMLVVGALFSTTGAGMAVSGIGNGDAGVAQYGTPTPTPGATPTPPPNDQVLPADDSGSTGDVKGDSQSSSGEPAAAVQSTRQVAAGANSNELPFTGFAAIPVLLGGIALLSTGLVLRHRTRNQRG